VQGNPSNRRKTMTNVALNLDDAELAALLKTKQAEALKPRPSLRNLKAVGARHQLTVEIDEIEQELFHRQLCEYLESWLWIEEGGSCRGMSRGEVLAYAEEFVADGPVLVKAGWLENSEMVGVAQSYLKKAA
jgi:hypothetical protein